MSEKLRRYDMLPPRFEVDALGQWVLYADAQRELAGLQAEVDRLLAEQVRDRGAFMALYSQDHNQRGSAVPALRKALAGLREENAALQRRCDRLVRGEAIESDHLTAEDDKLVEALAEVQRLRKCIASALKWAGEHWFGWGDRALSVMSILEGALADREHPMCRCVLGEEAGSEPTGAG